MVKAEVQWLQRNDLTRLDYDARNAAELSNLIGLDKYKMLMLHCYMSVKVGINIECTERVHWNSSKIFQEILVNGEKFQSHAVTVTLIGQCPISNSSKLFLYTIICSSFKWI